MRVELTREAALAQLYRHMMCSPGGVALLIRLRAQLDRCPADWVRAVVLDCDPRQLREVPGVASTFGWLERKFGRANAVRAVRETADEIMGAQTV